MIRCEEEVTPHMASCTTCGAQLGVGRFCTHCGAPVDSSVPDATPVSTPVTDGDWRTDTAERRMTVATADPRTPPAAVAPPPPPRYPLFADEVPGYTPYGPLTATTPEPAPPPAAPTPVAPVEPEPPTEPAYEPAYEPFAYHYDDERRSPVLWILAAALVLVLVAAGWWFLVRDDGSGATDSGGGAPSASGSQTSAKGTDVAGRASAKAPETAPPNVDVNGDQVSYDASNMLDGVPETAWRAPGDATGMTLTFTLRDPTELHQVGLVNGYAKTSTDSKGRTFDWYAGNRRIESVVWVFDDHSKVRQQLKETRDVQLVDVPDVVTGKVILKILKVSAPGKGTASRNFTAISEVSLVGDPQS
jgi:hypothetical protein